MYLAQENRGYAAGLNRAVKHLVESTSFSGLILAMNPDVRLKQGQIGALIDEHLSSKADCTFPAIREGKKVIYGYCLGRWGTLRRAESGADLFPGTCFLFSTDAWRKTCGFNEDYFHYFEDLDFCLRLQKVGCRVHHAAHVVIEHTGKSGTDYPAGVLPRYAVRSHLLFLSRHNKLNFLSFFNVIVRQFLYLFRWKKGWQGIRQWQRGIIEFVLTAKTP